MPSVKFSDLQEAFEFVNFGSPYTHNAYISRTTGEIFWESEMMDGEEEPPKDLGEPEHYIEIPHKNELDLGKRLVFRFVSSDLEEDYDEVEDVFRHKGAYSRYKALLERRGKLEAWYQYEEEATASALREWSESEGIELIEPPDG
jgi:hypothetical protein